MRRFGSGAWCKITPFLLLLPILALCVCRARYFEIDEAVRYGVWRLQKPRSKRPGVEDGEGLEGNGGWIGHSPTEIGLFVFPPRWRAARGKPSFAISQGERFTRLG